MFISTNGANGVTAAYKAGARQAVSGTVGRKQETLSGKFDHVDISHVPSDGQDFFRAVVARVAQEVRTVTTTGDIQAMKQQVRSGEYQPNPRELAAKMLLEGSAGVE